MKKRKMIITCLSIALAIVVVGAAYAANIDEDVTVYEKISERTIGIKENTVDESEYQLDVTPGSEIELKYNVENNGGINAVNGDYDAYVKVDIYFKFEKDDNLVERIEDDVNFYIFDGIEKKLLSEVDTYDKQYKVGDWIVTYMDDEMIEMYYTRPLVYGQKTSDFLSSLSFNNMIGNEYANANFVIETEVNAVQVNNGESAVAAEWGVYPIFDQMGNITAVSETKN